MGNSEKLKPTGEMIKARRIELGMSQPQFAQKLGKSLSSVKKYEYGTMEIGRASCRERVWQLV